MSSRASHFSSNQLKIAITDLRNEQRTLDDLLVDMGSDLGLPRSRGRQRRRQAEELPRQVMNAVDKVGGRTPRIQDSGLTTPTSKVIALSLEMYM